MSANIYWEPTARPKRTLSVMVPSTFIKVMENVFGEPPWTLGGTELERLQAMAEVCGDRENPYGELVNAICCEGGDSGTRISITVLVEW